MDSFPSQSNKGDILLVDDTPDNLRLLSTFLIENGYKVRSVISGSMALTAVKSAPPNLILLDINMPGINGYDVAIKLKSDPTTIDIPIIFISALNETLDKVKAFTVGGVDYITKPFQFEEVLKRVETHLTLRNLQLQLQQSNDVLEQRVQERTAELAALNTAYERFVPREFLSYLHKKSITEVGLGDQVQQEMTVLFSDIRNFTSISENMTPQENINFLNAYLCRISPVIRAHNGFIDKYLGDGIVALFPDKPEDAINAAIAMNQKLVEFNQKSDYQPVKTGTGIHTGEMMLGIIGEEERMQSTVIADAVNLASRLESLTKHYSVSLIISEETMSRVQSPERYNSRCVDNVQIRGKLKPVKVFEIFDGDEASLINRKLSTKEDFEAGLDLYYNKKFAEASVKFNNVLQTNLDDQTAKIYLERAARYMVNGVPAEWDGVELIAER